MGTSNTTREFAEQVVRTLQTNGFIAYFAGGCVRDRLMGREPADFDVATSARPEEVIKLFPRSQQVGIAFGVVLVRRKEHTVEVATFRTDGQYADGRRPASVTFSTPEEDAKRRDFTCNGLFFDPVANTLHDFVGGRKDIEAKLLRAIGQPVERFAEDHLRLLRAIRFSAKLRFTVETQTQAAMTALQEKIASISRERIGEEVRMMLGPPTRVAAVMLFAEFPVLFAEVFGVTPDSATSWPRLRGLPERARRAPALLAMLLDLSVPEPAARVADLRQRLMLSNEETADLQWLAEKLPAVTGWAALPTAGLKRLMAHQLWPALEGLYRADPVVQQELAGFDARLAELRRDPLAPTPLITGEDLIRLGASPGPAFKRWLEMLYDRQLENDLRDRAAALAAAKELVESGGAGRAK